MGYYFSKWKEAYTVPNHTADKLLTEFICRYGTLRQIHTYQGREFESELFIALCKKLGIEKIALNRTVPNLMDLSIGSIACSNSDSFSLCQRKKNDRDDHLLHLMMAYRATVHESTKCSANLIMLGRELSLPIDIMVGPPPGEKP